jgi:hypothetical protein
MFALANVAKILSRIAVAVDAGHLEPNDSPRGKSIFMTGSPKIYHEARGGAPELPNDFSQFSFCSSFPESFDGDWRNALSLFLPTSWPQL